MINNLTECKQFLNASIQNMRLLLAGLEVPLSKGDYNEVASRFLQVNNVSNVASIYAVSQSTVNKVTESFNV